MPREDDRAATRTGPRPVAVPPQHGRVGRQRHLPVPGYPDGADPDVDPHRRCSETHGLRNGRLSRRQGGRRTRDALAGPRRGPVRGPVGGEVGCFERAGGRSRTRSGHAVVLEPQGRRRDEQPDRREGRDGQGCSSPHDVGQRRVRAGTGDPRRARVRSPSRRPASTPTAVSTSPPARGRPHRPAHRRGPSAARRWSAWPAGGFRRRRCPRRTRWCSRPPRAGSQRGRWRPAPCRRRGHRPSRTLPARRPCPRQGS